MINIIPKINGKIDYKETCIKLPKQIMISFDGLDPFCGLAFAERLQKNGYLVNPIPFDVKQKEDVAWILLQYDTKLVEEEYQITIDESGVRVRTNQEIGAIWALTTLIRLIKDGTLPVCKICDKPKFAHRGISLDVARHFFSAEEVKRIIEQISMAKMNVLHLHLSDDQGWRIESKRFPKLQEISKDYYTQEEIREIVKYASIRGVEIIPEIDMPGHMRGILAAYPNLSCSGRMVNLARAGGIYRVIMCAGAERTYSFMEELLDEICPLFPSDRFHIGGDEAPKVEWQSCPECAKRMKEQGITDFHDLQGYFTIRISEILKKHGKTIICWNDSLMANTLPENMQMQYWSVQYNQPASVYISNGGKWIYSDMFELYLDYPYAMTPVRKIYENRIDLGSAPYDEKDIPIGMEACIWSEHIKESKKLEQLLFPRVYALAEIAWSGAEDYEEFEKRLLDEMARLKNAGICVTEQEYWNPEGQKRQQSAFMYMDAMNAEFPEEDKDEIVEPSQTGQEFGQKFMARFFKEEDLPILMKSLGQ